MFYVCSSQLMRLTQPFPLPQKGSTFDWLAVCGGTRAVDAMYVA
jgi:hypothetical protein